jgi:hypothetical protein
VVDAEEELVECAAHHGLVEDRDREVMKGLLDQQNVSLMRRGIKAGNRRDV